MMSSKLKNCGANVQVSKANWVMEGGSSVVTSTLFAALWNESQYCKESTGGRADEAE